jgi:hypothetical protein
MEGISTTVYQEKSIYMIDFSHYGESKEDTVGMIRAIGDEFRRNPINSVLALIDVTHAFFHFEILKAFSQLQERYGQYQKKVAVIGLKGLKKAGFNRAVGSRKDVVKAFDSEQEAKAWLVSD